MNPDQDMILRFAEDGTPIAMNTSPLVELLGARLERYDADAQEMTMSFTPPEAFRQGAGVVQGGAVSMMLDFVLAFCAMPTLGPEKVPATVSLATDFMGAARGARVTATGNVERAGRNMVFTRGWLTDGDRKVAAAQSALMVVPA